MTTTSTSTSPVVHLPAPRYVLLCVAVALLIGGLTWNAPASANLLAIAVFTTVIALFVFGSIRYRLDKNVITYGAFPIILMTFLPLWWPHSQLREEMARSGGAALWAAVQHHVLSLHGLEKLLHADTMLFILGLTFFVSVIAQTRLLEAISLHILRRFAGNVLLTTLVIAGLVSIASGILDGVSMIGLTIRVLVIILAMAKLRADAIEFAIMVSVVLTTVCGMWLAYGEPPNLIMKSNLNLPDSFFLTYTLPMALVTFVIVAAFLRRWLHQAVVPLAALAAVERDLAEDATRAQRQAAQRWAKLAFLPFIALLLWHARNHDVPLFASSAVGFAVAFIGVAPHASMRGPALREAAHEYQEYLFLFPLFLSITMLTAVGFFDQIRAVIEQGVASLGPAHVAVIQFVGTGLLSALLDNNVVADFASRAIEGMSEILLFAAAQVAGYATGGSLTHIGSAQSVVAFAYILRYVDPHFTPLDWVRAMWKLILTIAVALSGMIYLLAVFSAGF